MQTYFSALRLTVSKGYKCCSGGITGLWCSLRMNLSILFLQQRILYRTFLSGCGQTTIWKNYFLRHFLLIFLLLSGMLATRMNIVKNRRRDMPPEANIAVETALEMDSEVADRINRAISKLPVQTRAVVTRILLEEMKYKDAAAELNISVNTLKTLLRNGLRTLRSELEKDYRSINFAVYLLWNSSAPLVLYA